MAINYESFKSGGLLYVLQKLKNVIDGLLAGKVDKTTQATDSALGLVKTNSTDGISLNASGQLDIGGRLGQFPDGGLYYPTTAAPSAVGLYSLMMGDAVNLGCNNRNFILFGGMGITLKSSHAAGSTTYRVRNTFANRFIAMAMKGGRATLNADTAPQYTVAITSIKFADGTDVYPHSGPTESNNDIIITTAISANPDSATTAIRGYGSWTSTDIVSVGQNNGSGNGKTLMVGQNLRGEANQNVLIGNSIFSSGANSAMFGHSHVNRKQFAMLAGRGHDSSSGSDGVSAVGQWSIIDSNTAFAVGNGTTVTARSNAFEVTKDGGMILPSPDGTRWKITVDNTGTVTTVAVS